MNTQLIERLRAGAFPKGVGHWGDLHCEAADALEAREREVAELRWDRENLIGMGSRAAQANDTLRAKLEAIRAQEPVAFLCDATRFKVLRCDGDETGRILGLPKELNGRWVALVAADDDCHLNAVASQDVGALVEAFDAGFRCAAGWAQRDDLFADINLPTYKKDRTKYLAALTQSQATRVPDACVWTPDMDEETGIHYSTCGEAWAFNDGGPNENNVRFCQGCGKPVKLAAAPGKGGAA